LDRDTLSPDVVEEDPEPPPDTVNFVPAEFVLARELSE